MICRRSIFFHSILQIRIRDKTCLPNVHLTPSNQTQTTSSNSSLVHNMQEWGRNFLCDYINKSFHMVKSYTKFFHIYKQWCCKSLDDSCTLVYCLLVNFGCLILFHISVRVWMMPCIYLGLWCMPGLLFLSVLFIFNDNLCIWKSLICS